MNHENAATQFVKLATEHGINLEELTDEQVNQLWNQTMKVAEADAGSRDDADLAAAAEYEFQVKQAQAQRVQDAYIEGQIMAEGFLAKLAEADAAKRQEQPQPQHQVQQKQASALTRLAAREAVKLAADATWDPNEVAAKLEAAFILGRYDDESQSKVASAANPKQAVQLRALELLEGAGYEIDWSKIGQ